MFDISETGGVEPDRRVEVPQHPERAECFEVQLANYVFPAPPSGSARVDMPVLLTPPLEERNARAEATEGVSQRLAPEVIRKVVRDHFPGFGECYEALGHPLPDASATLRFTIARDGKVSDGEVESPEQPKLGGCLDTEMRSMLFPPPEDGIVTVTYPIFFSPGKPEAALVARRGSPAASLSAGGAAPSAAWRPA